MKVLVVSTGTSGDVLPFLAIGAALAQRGHEVHALTLECYRRWAEDVGLTFHPVSGVTGNQDDPDFYDSVGSIDAVARGLLLPAVRPVLAFISQLDPRDWTIVSHPHAYGSRIANELRGYRLITCIVSPLMIRSLETMPVTPGIALPNWAPHVLKRMFFRMVARLWDRALGAPLNQIRQEAGLPSVNDIFYGWSFSPETVIALFPEWFAPKARDWPRQLTHGGFVVHAGGEAADDSVLAEFARPGDPVVTFCAGSAGRSAHWFFDAAVAASRGRRWRALLLAPGYSETNMPPNVFRAGFIPLGKVLPSSAAIVHHGGMGTLSAAMAHGTPQIAVPFGHDQFDNAARLNRLGVATVIPSRTRLPQRMARAVEDVLTREPVRTRSKELASRTKLDQGMAAICAAIEGSRGSTAAS
jgi:rhamnosyltransferase subunit B